MKGLKDICSVNLVHVLLAAMLLMANRDNNNDDDHLKRTAVADTWPVS